MKDKRYLKQIKKMKTKSEMNLEKLDLMRDKPKKGIFHAKKAIVYRQSTEHRGK